ncbi:DEAD/DEAH box helicase [Lacticaseibacillus paracasei]|uniref:DEAD/DEAH box helicase n=1 Tax=Lacticaseibacillus paracasei TaxID=1597 RepID=UPI003F62DC48
MDNTNIFEKVDTSIKENPNYKKMIASLKCYLSGKSISSFIIDRPLSGAQKDYQYEYKTGFMILVPGLKLLFSTIEEIDTEEFKNFRLDFLDDINSLSDKYKHKEILGRTRSWQALTDKIDISKLTSKADPWQKYSLNNTNKRKAELLITLLTGSVNDPHNIKVEAPRDLLDAIKHRITLFDADQTRFIYNDLSKKVLSIQGLAGTGKTELLLHKLYDIYAHQDTANTRVVFTCFNKILANEMKNRIPAFFDFMKVDEQIQWGKRLWVMRSWGSLANPEEGIYSHICYKYNLPFKRYSNGIKFDELCTEAISMLEKIPNLEPCFDYTLIDEGQDFDDSFFRLCSLVTSKQVIIASDIFQNIFDKRSSQTSNPDFTLNKVYRTDPKTFMFAQLFGFGVEEPVGVNWLEDNTWRTCGYSFDVKGTEYTFTREPLTRFEDIGNCNETPLILRGADDKKSTIEHVVSIIQEIIDQNPRVEPDDIGIVFLSGSKQDYEQINRLAIEINKKYDWLCQKGYETKSRESNRVFISNRNNVKGLEFPFVICVINEKIEQDYIARDSIYMALTRSFITSYLVYSPDNQQLMSQYDNLYNQIIKTGKATVSKPKITISETDISNQTNKTQQQVADSVFKDLHITDSAKKGRLSKVISVLAGKSTDYAAIRSIVEKNKDF